jgi:hypothetical protein
VYFTRYFSDIAHLATLSAVKGLIFLHVMGDHVDSRKDFCRRRIGPQCAANAALHTAHAQKSQTG